MKLVVPEVESRALALSLRSWTLRVTSELALVEVGRAAGRYGGRAAEESEALPALLALRPIDRELLRAAARLAPRQLRALDAIHLATALALDPLPDAFFTYDVRLSDAARAAGLTVEAPA